MFRGLHAIHESSDCPPYLSSSAQSEMSNEIFVLSATELNFLERK